MMTLMMNMYQLRGPVIALTNTNKMRDSDNTFHETNVYNDYVKLKLLIKGKVSKSIYADYLTNGNNAKQTVLQSTSPTTAHRLIRCKLYDLFIVEVCHCLHNQFRGKSVFTISWWVYWQLNIVSLNTIIIQYSS